MNKKWYFKEADKIDPTDNEIQYANKIFNRWKDILTSKDKYKYNFYYFKKHALLDIDEDIEREIDWEFSEAQPSTHQILSLCRVKKVIENLQE